MLLYHENCVYHIVKWVVGSLLVWWMYTLGSENTFACKTIGY